MDSQTASSLTSARSRRRSLRRAVDLEVDVMCDLWNGAVPLLATNLSLHGAWLEADLALSVGDELRLAFDPPRYSGLPRLQTTATVARVSLLRRQRDSGRAGMGLCFSELSSSTRRCLDYALRGLPPPLPASRELLEAQPGADESAALLRLEGGECYVLCAEAPLLTSARPAPRRVQAPAAAPLRKRFWFETRAQAPFARSPMTAIFEQPRRHARCALG
jgi:hypothetical protein